MLIVLGAAAVAVYIWAWWLVRSGRAPRWLRWAAAVVVIATIACAGYTIWALSGAFRAVEDVNPADKASMLAHGISSALDVLAIGIAIAGAGAIACGYFTVRPRRSSPR
ncbi:MAG TPA: hypothetical protein VGF94_24480 [Kofleriaceae bacterium]|jgi:hypothetical protein